MENHLSINNVDMIEFTFISDFSNPFLVKFATLLFSLRLLIPYSRPNLPDFYILPQNKLLENHTLFTAAHTYIGYIWESPPGSYTFLMRFIAHNMVFLREIICNPDTGSSLVNRWIKELKLTLSI